MYVAYSEKMRDNVNVHDVYDLNEVFCCPNRRCGARYKIKSATGKKVKHFARLKSTPHVEGCFCENGDSRYVQPNFQIRKSVEEIYEDFLNPNNAGYKAFGENRNGEATENILRINTPKKLLKFCLMNPVQTEYMNGLKVDDIIVDARNLFTDARFEGVAGLRMIVGETVERYRPDILELRVMAVSKRGKPVYLHAQAKMDSALLQYVRKHITKTYDSFADHPIAVFGNWTIDRKYHISCNVTDRKHVIVRF